MEPLQILNCSFLSVVLFTVLSLRYFNHNIFLLFFPISALFCAILRHSQTICRFLPLFVNFCALFLRAFLKMAYSVPSPGIVSPKNIISQSLQNYNYFFDINIILHAYKHITINTFIYINFLFIFSKNFFASFPAIFKVGRRSEKVAPGFRK